MCKIKEKVRVVNQFEISEEILGQIIKKSKNRSAAGTAGIASFW